MKYGLLKAFLVEPDRHDEGLIKSSWDRVPSDPKRGADRYVNRPDRPGVTLAYGFVNDRLMTLVGRELSFALGAYLRGPETAFFLCDPLPFTVAGNGSTLEAPPMIGEDDPHLIALDLTVVAGFKYPPHITMGWVQGSAAVVAGKEADRFFQYRVENHWKLCAGVPGAGKNYLTYNDPNFEFELFGGHQVIILPAIVEFKELPQP